MRFRMARLMVPFACAVMALAIATPSAAQVSTGRIDASIGDSTGAVLPGVTVEISGPQNQSAVTDAMGEAHFLNLNPGTYTVRAKLSGFSDYYNKNIVVATGTSVPLKIALSIAGVATQVQVTGEAPVVDTKKMTTSTNVSVEELQSIPSVARPVGRAAERPRRDRRSRQRRRRRVGPAVELPGQGRGRRRQHLEHRRHRGHRHGGDRLDADLLRLRHVPGDAGHDRRRRRHERHARRAAEHGAQERHATRRTAARASTSRTKTCRPTTCRPISPASIGGASGKGNRHAPVQGLRVRAGRPDPEGQAVGLGRGRQDPRRPDHPDRRRTTAPSCRTPRSRRPARCSNGVRANFTFFRGNKEKFGRGASATHPPETTYDQTGPTPLYKGEGNFVVGTNFVPVGARRRTRAAASA